MVRSEEENERGGNVKKGIVERRERRERKKGRTECG